MSKISKLNKNEVERLNEGLRSTNPLASLSNVVRWMLNKVDGNRELVLAKLEEFRIILQNEGRGDDEDRVLEVMDFLVGWSSPHSRIVDQENSNARENDSLPSLSTGTKPNLPKPEIRIIFPGTSGGIWADRHQAALTRDLYFPPTATKNQTIAILDLTGIIPSPGVLQDLILPLAQRIKGGIHGQFTLIVRTHDQGVADFIGYLAKEHNLNIFVVIFSHDLQEAQPVGNITNVELTTLNFVNFLGGKVTATELAQVAGIGKTAAGNRLVGLAEKGIVYRFEQARNGDLFIDPRTQIDEAILSIGSH